MPGSPPGFLDHLWESRFQNSGLPDWRVRGTITGVLEERGNPWIPFLRKGLLNSQVQGRENNPWGSSWVPQGRGSGSPLEEGES